jgi:hypothetical protein
MHSVSMLITVLLMLVSCHTRDPSTLKGNLEESPVAETSDEESPVVETSDEEAPVMGTSGEESLVVATSKEERAPVAKRMFHCHKLPNAGTLRTCSRKAEYCEGSCFQLERAQCYIRSIVNSEFTGWSKTERDASCFPTKEECEKDRAGVGAWGPPPFQSDCLSMGIEELP